jgi:hypothetical protein
MLAVLVSELGELIRKPPPDYRTAWMRSGQHALSYSTSVASTVIRLWRYLHKEPGLISINALPLRIGSVVDTLAELATTWIERWKIRFRGETGFDVWSPRARAGGGDRITDAGLSIDLGPPYIDVYEREYNRLRWAFEILRDYIQTSPPQRPIEPGAPESTTSPLGDFPPASPTTTQAKGMGKVGARSTTPKTKRRKKGDAAVLIIAALESLAKEGKWDVTEGDIINRAGVSRSTYYNVINNDSRVKRVVKDYRSRRLGRGPVRSNDI